MRCQREGKINFITKFTLFNKCVLQSNLLWANIFITKFKICNDNN